ncbi:MAG: hypothetical protein V1863_02150 [Candidatus Omnitrophota bacterium]
MPPKKQPSSGLTLGEAVLVLTIMSITAAVVLPHFGKEGFLGSLSQRSVTSQIASDIRQTRQLAITRRGHYLIGFNFVQKTYAIYLDSVSPANQQGETKEIPSDVTCSGTNQFDFYSLGNAVFSGSGVFVTQGSHQNQIVVDAPTGVVAVEKIS